MSPYRAAETLMASQHDAAVHVTLAIDKLVVATGYRWKFRDRIATGGAPDAADIGVLMNWAADAGGERLLATATLLEHFAQIRGLPKAPLLPVEAEGFSGKPECRLCYGTGAVRRWFEWRETGSRAPVRPCPSCDPWKPRPPGTPAPEPQPLVPA